MKKRKWLLLLRVLDVLAVGEGGNRRPVNLYYTFIFMICIHLYLLFSSVCVCVYVCVHLWNEREQPWTNSMWHFRIQPGRELWIFLDRDYYAHVS